MMSRRAAVSAISLISGREFRAHKWAPFSLFSSNFHSDRAKVATIDFSRVKELDDAVHLFHEMVRMRPQPSVTAYNKLLSITAKMKHYSLALQMYDEMRQMGTPVSEYTMTIAINCYCLQRRVDFGFSIMGIFFKSGYKPTAATFGILIKCLVLDDKVADAVKLFKKLLDFRLCEPDDIMILTVIYGLCKAGQIVAAHDLFCRLERSKWKPMLGVISYSALLDLLKYGLRNNTSFDTETAGKSCSYWEDTFKVRNFYVDFFDDMRSLVVLHILSFRNSVRKPIIPRWSELCRLLDDD